MSAKNCAKQITSIDRVGGSLKSSRRLISVGISFYFKVPVEKLDCCNTCFNPIIFSELVFQLYQRFRCEMNNQTIL
jgi:hypothetical protein